MAQLIPRWKHEKVLGPDPAEPCDNGKKCSIFAGLSQIDPSHELQLQPPRRFGQITLPISMGALLSLFRLIGLVGRGAAALRRLNDSRQQRNPYTTRPTATAAGTANGSAGQSGLGFLFHWLTSAQLTSKPPLPTCPICMDPVPPASASNANQQAAAIMLVCGHVFCGDCVGPYATTKVRARQVEWDQLVCPVVACKRALNDLDLRAILPTDTFDQYTRTLQRVRDEKNPLARWCPRPQCGELIVCEPDTSGFTCPTCTAVGCFHCRGMAHRFAFLCKFRVKGVSEDASYLKWENSVGHTRAVRACPKCQMRIWKSGGCNHMTCVHCRHEYCWVCHADWQRSHYACSNHDHTSVRTITSAVANAPQRWVAAVTRIPGAKLQRLAGQALWGIAVGVLLAGVVVIYVAALVGLALAPLRRWWLRVCS